MATIKDILLRITGDGDDARRELSALARDLAAFGAEEAEATAKVNTTAARVELERLEQQLNSIDGEDVSADANVRIGGALAEIAELKAALASIGDADIDVDVHRGVLERIRALGGEVGKIAGDFEQATTSGEEAGSMFSKVGVNIGAFSARGGTLLRVLPALIPLIVALGAGVALLVASAAEAAAGLGALGIAAGGALMPIAGLVVAGIARFKQQSDQAGTAAHALAGAFNGIGDAAKTLLPAADPALRALAKGLRGVDDVIKGIRPAFVAFGKQAGDAVQLVMDRLTGPGWTKAIADLIRLSGPVMKPAVSIMVTFGKVLVNIARASMPFLVHGLQDVAHWMGQLAKGTDNVKGLRSAIAPLIGQLKSWLNLTRAVSNMFIAFVDAVGPIGERFVNWLAKGADALADWMKSDKGRKQIQEFFNRVLPLTKELVKFVLLLALAFVQFGELMAPVMTLVLRAVNFLLGGLNKILAFLVDLDRATSHWGQTFSAIGNAIAGVVSGIANGIAGVAGTVIDAVKGLDDKTRGILGKVITFLFFVPVAKALGQIRDLYKTARAIITGTINFVLHAPRTVIAAVRSIWQTAKGIVTAVINFLLKVPRDPIGAARDVWQAVKGVVSDAINFVLKMPEVGGLVSLAKGIWNKINAALPDITLHIEIPKPSLPSIPHPHFMAGVRDFGGGAAVVGEAGPELAFFPTGTDVFSNEETRNILRALASGSFPGGAGPPSGDRTVIQEQNITVPPIPGTGIQDPRITAALLAQQVRQRGQRKG